MPNLRAALARLVPVLLAAAGPAFAGPSSPFVLQQWAPHGATAQARYGAVVAPAGDVNGDGYSDVLVSAPKDEGPAADAGKVFVYLGSKTGLATLPAWSWSANQATGATGTAAAAAGDVNGDGYGDVVIGTPRWNAPGPVAVAGKISVFHGGPAGLPASPTYERLAPTPTANARFGFAVATAGDVNGDGYDDVVVGAPSHTTGGLTGRGAAYVFLGGASGLAAAPATTLLGAQAGANFGKAVSTAGDVDGDGFADVLVGAPRDLFTGLITGTASFFRGSGAGLIAAPDTVIGGEHTYEETGAAVANAGDVNGDGYADVLIGHPGWANGDVNWGEYEFIPGGPGGLVGPSILITGNDAGERLGASVATLGDINADGYADFAVGAPYDSAQTPDARVFVHMGGKNAISPQIQLTSSSGQGLFFGFSIATAGDIDGDGFSEFLVGDPAASVVPAAAEGTAVLYKLVRSVPDFMPDTPVFSGETGTFRAAAVAIAPGLDVSGNARVIVGEPGYDGGGTDIGILYTYPGSSDGVQLGGFTSELGQSAGDQFSAVIADVGDIDRDGYGRSRLLPDTQRRGGTEAGPVCSSAARRAGPLHPCPCSRVRRRSRAWEAQSPAAATSTATVITT